MNAKIEVKELPEMKLAGITHTGEFDKTPGIYEKLFQWAGDKELLNNPNFKAVTIYHDNPKITQLTKSRWSVCITIDNDIATDGEVRQISIPKGKYAIGHFEITSESFPKAWESMPIWVIENGYKFKDGYYPPFEIFHNDYKTHPEQKFIVDICIPIE